MVCAQQSEPEFEFRRLKAASGRTVDGAEFSTQVYTSSDGVTLSVRVDTFKSSGLARRQLMKLVRGAKIIDRELKVDKSGKELQKQFITRFPSRRSDDASFGVLWTERAQLYSITASSLRHVLEFEKRFKP